MPLARFRIVADAGEPLSVQFNGAALPDGIHVTGLSLHVVEGVPQLALAVSGQATIEGEGIVYVQAENGDAREEMRNLLLQLDPDELDRKALEHSPTLDSKPGQGYVGALLEMIG